MLKLSFSLSHQERDDSVSPCASMSYRPTEQVYLTRSDKALDNFIVFFFLQGRTKE